MESLKNVLSYRGLGINVKKCLYEGVVVSAASCGAEACCVRGAEFRRKVGILGMGVSP